MGRDIAWGFKGGVPCCDFFDFWPKSIDVDFDSRCYTCSGTSTPNNFLALPSHEAQYIIPSFNATARVPMSFRYDPAHRRHSTNLKKHGKHIQTWTRTSPATAGQILYPTFAFLLTNDLRLIGLGCRAFT